MVSRASIVWLTVALLAVAAVAWLLLFSDASGASPARRSGGAGTAAAPLDGAGAGPTRRAPRGPRRRGPPPLQAPEGCVARAPRRRRGTGDGADRRRGRGPGRGA